MKRGAVATNPDAYVDAIQGWQGAQVEILRAAARAAGQLEDCIKWGYRVYDHQGPALLIRAEDTRVPAGFWRGARLRSMEPRLKRGGKYGMATATVTADRPIATTTATALAAEAIALDRSLGDPTAAARR